MAKTETALASSSAGRRRPAPIGSAAGSARNPYRVQTQPTGSQPTRSQQGAFEGPLVRRATGPGRVNLIGDHTDYNEGVALPMAIDLGVTVEWGRTGVADASDRPTLTVTSTAFDGRVEVPLGEGAWPDPSEAEPRWARPVAAMVALVPPIGGGTLRIDSTLPIGSGLASSAALLVAMVEVLGVTGTPASIASLCQRAEHLGGVPVGAMDPLVCAGGRRGAALLIDFSTMATRPVPLPEGVDIVVVDSGRSRSLEDTPYATRVQECAAAAVVIGPLGLAEAADLAAVEDPVLHRRSRHVITECGRVGDMVEAFRADDLVAAGALMTDSQRSLADDFEVSTPEVDAVIDGLVARPGVLGARLTGAGFGGCVVALCHAGALDPADLELPAWRVVAVDGPAGGGRRATCDP